MRRSLMDATSGGLPTDRALASPAPYTPTREEHKYETRNSQPPGSHIRHDNRRLCSGRKRPGSSAFADRHRAVFASADDYLADGGDGNHGPADASADEIAAPRLAAC